MTQDLPLRSASSHDWRASTVRLQAPTPYPYPIMRRTPKGVATQGHFSTPHQRKEDDHANGLCETR
jgi:hypothetical protein